MSFFTETHGPRPLFTDWLSVSSLARWVSERIVEEERESACCCGRRSSFPGRERPVRLKLFAMRRVTLFVNGTCTNGKVSYNREAGVCVLAGTKMACSRSSTPPDLSAGGSGNGAFCPRARRWWPCTDRWRTCCVWPAPSWAFEPPMCTTGTAVSSTTSR